MIFMNLEVSEWTFFICWSIQTILYYLSLIHKTSYRVDLIFILVSVHGHRILWNKFQPLFYGLIFAYIFSIIGFVIFIPISLQGCIDFRKDTISLFGINRTRILMFTSHKLKKMGDFETKDRRYVDSNIILENGTFHSRARNVLAKIVDRNQEITGIFSKDWTIDVLNSTVTNGMSSNIIRLNNSTNFFVTNSDNT